jgi:hypothetical protein
MSSTSAVEINIHAVSAWFMSLPLFKSALCGIAVKSKLAAGSWKL